jgi:hypothetical protein
MRKYSVFLGLFAAAILVGGLVGCESTDKSAAKDGGNTIALCSGCGQVKGGDACCKGGPTCPKCELAKGSPGCCLYHKGDKAVSLCAKCGYVAGSDKCCAPGNEKCACGMAHGSPGCCKIKQGA